MVFRREEACGDARPEKENTTPSDASHVLRIAGLPESKSRANPQLRLGVVVMMVMVMVVVNRCCLRRKRSRKAEDKNEPKQKLLHALL